MPPLTVMVKPSSGACNLKCEYCFYRDEMAHRACGGRGFMSQDTADALLDRIFEYADTSVSIAFQGGEPTLIGADFFEIFLSLAKEKNFKKIPMHFSVQTNGYDISDEMLRFLKENHILVGLSLDGTRSLHNRYRKTVSGANSFDEVAKTAERLRENGVAFNVLCVVTSAIAKQPANVFHALAKYEYVQFIPCLEPLDGKGGEFSLTPNAYARFLKETFQLYYQSWKNGKPVSVRSFDNFVAMTAGRPPEECSLNGRCSAYMTVEADGSVYPCDFYVLDEWKIGNVQENRIEDMLSSDTAQRFIDSSIKKMPECSACPYFFLCRGGCRRYRAERGGELHEYRFCSSYRDFFAYALPYLREMAAAVR